MSDIPEREASGFALCGVPTRQPPREGLGLWLLLLFGDYLSTDGSDPSIGPNLELLLQFRLHDESRINRDSMKEGSGEWAGIPERFQDVFRISGGAFPPYLGIRAV